MNMHIISPERTGSYVANKFLYLFFLLFLLDLRCFESTSLYPLIPCILSSSLHGLCLASIHFIFLLPFQLLLPLSRKNPTFLVSGHGGVLNFSTVRFHCMFCQRGPSSKVWEAEQAQMSLISFHVCRVDIRAQTDEILPRWIASA